MSIDKKTKIKSGFTLVEVLCALTIVLVVCLVLFNMFHASIKYSNKIMNESIAAIIADKKIEEVRAWAYTFNDSSSMYNFNDTSWSGYSPYAEADSTNPSFTVKLRMMKGGPYYDTTNDESALYFPSTGSEAGKTHRRAMKFSMVRIQATVIWDNGTSKYTTVACIAEPIRPLKRINITTISSTNPVFPDKKNIYHAQGYDENDKPIDDLLYKWYMNPITGNGEIIHFPEPVPLSISSNGQDPLLGTGESPADPIRFTMGNRSVFINRIKAYNWLPESPSYIYCDPGGTCKISVRAKSGGVEVINESGLINVRK